jgi:hypothetical protein
MSCEQSAWGFETGLEGWRAPSLTRTGVLTGEASTTGDRFHSGARAMTAPVNVSILGGFFRLVYFDCGYTPATGTAEFLDLHAKTLSAWIFAAGASDDLVGWCRWLVQDDKLQPVGLEKPPTTVAPGTWIQVQTVLDETQATRTTAIELNCEFKTNAVSWPGAIYVDDVSIK